MVRNNFTSQEQSIKMGFSRLALLLAIQYPFTTYEGRHVEKTPLITTTFNLFIVKREKITSVTKKEMEKIPCMFFRPTGTGWEGKISVTQPHHTQYQKYIAVTPSLMRMYRNELLFFFCPCVFARGNEIFRSNVRVSALIPYTNRSFSFSVVEVPHCADPQSSSHLYFRSACEI